jgi:transposase-like protein
MKNDRKHSSGQSPEEIAALISRYRASKVGLEQFAREYGIPPGRLHYWLYQKHRGASPRGRAKPTRAGVAPVFQELKLTARTPLVESWAAEVNLPQGVAVRFNGAAPAEWISSVVQALQRPC